MQIGIKKDVIHQGGLNAELKAALMEAYDGLLAHVGEGGICHMIVDDGKGVIVSFTGKATPADFEKADEVVRAHQAQSYIEAGQAETAAPVGDDFIEILMKHEHRLKVLENMLTAGK